MLVFGKFKKRPEAWNPRRETMIYGSPDGSHLIKLPAIYEIDLGNFVEYRIEKERSFPIISEERVETEYKFFAVQVSKATNLIVSTRSQISYGILKPLPANRVAIYGFLRCFDANEKLTGDGHDDLVLSRISEPSNQDIGHKF